MKRFDKFMLLIMLILLYEVITSSIGSNSSITVSPKVSSDTDNVIKEIDKELVRKSTVEDSVTFELDENDPRVQCSCPCGEDLDSLFCSELEMD